MVSKQDKQAARTAADLERRYGTRFSEIMGVAEEAMDTAERAEETAEEAKKSFDGLDQTQIFKLLTNDGAAQGMFLDDKGQIYINASYLAAGIIASVSGAVKLDLTGNKLEISIPPSSMYTRQTKIVFNDKGISGYGDGDQDDGAHLEQTLAIMPAPYTQYPENRSGYWTRVYAFDADLLLDATSPTLPSVKRAVRVGSEDSVVKVLGKAVSWKDNGDGTYTLIGTDEEE